MDVVYYVYFSLILTYNESSFFHFCYADIFYSISESSAHYKIFKKSYLTV